MPRRLAPMLHVPDVEATARWYESVGFTVIDLGRECDDGPVVWGLLGWGDSRVMLSTGGLPSDAFRREADLYLYADDIDTLFAELGPRCDVVEPPHDTFYGMREFIVRDFNRFWITFGQEPTG